MANPRLNNKLTTSLSNVYALRFLIFDTINHTKRLMNKKPRVDSTAWELADTPSHTALSKSELDALDIEATKSVENIDQIAAIRRMLQVAAFLDAGDFQAPLSMKTYKSALSTAKKTYGRGFWSHAAFVRNLAPPGEAVTEDDLDNFGFTGATIALRLCKKYGRETGLWRFREALAERELRLIERKAGKADDNRVISPDFARYASSKQLLKFLRAHRKAAYKKSTALARLARMKNKRTRGTGMPIFDSAPTPVRPRDRSGYEQPNRGGKVGLIAYVEPELRAEVNSLAKAAGMTTQDFLTLLAENAVKAAKQNPAVAETLANEARLRQEAEESRRQRVVKSLAPKALVNG